MSTYTKDYRSDIVLNMHMTFGDATVDVPDHDFILRFYTDIPGRHYDCGRIGGELLHCATDDDDSTLLTCYIKNHGLGCGVLQCLYIDLSENEGFEDGIQRTYSVSEMDVELVDDTSDDTSAVVGEVAIDINAVLEQINEAIADAEASQLLNIADISYTASDESDGYNILTITQNNGTVNNFNIKNGGMGNIDDRVEALEESVFDVETATWTDGCYYSTYGYSTVGSPGQTAATTTVNNLCCLKVDLSNVVKVDFKTQGVSQYTYPFYFLDENDNVLYIDTTTGSAVEHSYTEDTFPTGAVALYLNNSMDYITDHYCTVTSRVVGYDYEALEDRVDALEDVSYTDTTYSLTSGAYYDTYDYRTIGQTGQTSMAVSGTYSCAKIELDLDNTISIYIKSYGNAYAAGWYFLDENNLLLAYNDSGDATVTLAKDDIPSGAKWLYINNNPNYIASPTCIITTTTMSEKLKDKLDASEMYVTETPEWNADHYYSTSANYTEGEEAMTTTSSSTNADCLVVDLTEPFESIYVKCYGPSIHVLPYYFVDADGILVQRCDPLSIAIEATITPDTMPATAVGLYINNWTTDSPDYACVITRNRLDVLESNTGQSQPLAGKNVVCFGDSITEFVDSTWSKSYTDYFAEKTGATVYNVGIGGSCLTRSDVTPSTSNAKGLYVIEMVDAWVTQDFTNPDAGVVYRTAQGDTHDAEQVARLKSILPADTDIVTILAGTNDWDGYVTLGSSSDTTDVLNVFGAIKHIVEVIHTVNPNIEIYFFTPPVRWIKDADDNFPDANWCDVYTGASSGYMLEEFCDGIMAAARYCHVPCCNLYREMNWDEHNWLTIAEDGTHPRNGFEAIGNKVANFVTSAGVYDGAVNVDLAAKQDTLVSGTNIKTINSQSLLGSGDITISGSGTIDPSPTQDSTNAVSSGGVYTALAAKQNLLTFDLAPTSGSAHPVTSGGVYTALAAKQDTLVSGTNIKSVNGTSLLGSGNLNASLIPVLTDTRSSTTSTITTSAASFDSLVSGQVIAITLAYNTAASTQIQVTLSDNTTTTAAALKSQTSSGSTQIGSNTLKKNTTIMCLYNGSEWWLMGMVDTNSIYAALSYAAVADSTSTSSGLVSGASLHYAFYGKSDIDTYLAAKQDTLTFDASPTSSSTNPVTSGGVYTADANRQLTLCSVSAPLTGDDLTNGYYDGIIYEFGTTDTVVFDNLVSNAGMTGTDRKPEWMFTFTCSTASCSVTLPTGCKLPVNKTMEMAADRYFECSIINNSLSFECWD